MGMKKRALGTLVALVAIAGSLTSCASTAPASRTPSQEASATSVAQPSDGTEKWPAGADTDTPACQDASSAVLAVVNTSLLQTASSNGTVMSALPWLSAHPDPDLGKWTLTGLVETTQGTEGGYFVVFATSDDPTSPAFDGAVFSLGAATGLTTLPPLEPAYVGPTDMDDVPPTALSCGTQRSQNR
jgi:hypothetical protein